MRNNTASDVDPDWQPLGAVGGVAEPPDDERMSLSEAEGSSGVSTGVIAAIAAVAAGAIALGGTAWHAWRRLTA